MATECASSDLISFKPSIMTSFDNGVFKRLQMIYMHRYEPEYSRTFANLFWRGALTLACVVIVGAGIYGATVFFGALPQSSTNTSTAGPAVSAGSNLNHTQLDATLNNFAARQATFKSLQTGAIPSVADPSK